MMYRNPVHFLLPIIVKSACSRFLRWERRRNDGAGYYGGYFRGKSAGSQCGKRTYSGAGDVSPCNQASDQTYRAAW